MAGTRCYRPKTRVAPIMCTAPWPVAVAQTHPESARQCFGSSLANFGNPTEPLEKGAAKIIVTELWPGDFHLRLKLGTTFAPHHSGSRRTASCEPIERARCR